MAATRCLTLTVDDAPAGEDVFGSHEPIAAAVHELIRTEPGGRTIGLEGSWGSGKSTVVRLLADRLDKPGEHVVMFDAWAHEGDPLRRSFLETLIKSLSRKRWVEEQRWSERREELARRRRVEHTHPVSKIERPAIIAGVGAALFAILVPLGAALVGAGLAANESWAFWTGVAFYVALVLLVAGGAAWLLRGRSGPAGGALLSLFSVESVTESTRETLETPDPTSIEFESTFKDLMQEALSAPRARRLVLVVDNLDRVVPDDARSIWATLQTFLHHSHDDREPWLDSLWVLLPYDRAGIARLWDSSPGDLHEGTQPRDESFIDKSIQVRFEVPLPLLSDWRTYLESALRSALPDCAEADAYAAYRLYALRPAKDGGRAPSPRELKQYVNRVGALHRQWQHALPFASLAYYASLGGNGVKVADCLRRGTLPESGPAGLLGDDVDAHLAAIAFNTDPERARQLLLGPLIDRALRRDVSDELVELLGRPGFWEALLQAPIVQPGMGTPVLLNGAARLLDVPEEQRPDAEWREVTSLLARQGLAIEDWPPLTRESADDLSGLLSLLDQRAAADIAARATAAAIPADGAAAWAEGAYALLGRFEWLTVHASGAPDAVCDVLTRSAALEGWADGAGRLRIELGTRAALDEVIVARIAQEPVDAFRALFVLRRVEPGIEWGPFVEASANRLRNDAPSRGVEPQPTAKEARRLLGILLIAQQSSAQERVALVNEGVALEYVWLANEQGDPAALGDWLYEEFRKFSPESSDTRSYSGPAQAGKNLVDALLADPSNQPVGPLAHAIECRSDFDVIASIGVHAEGEALAGALIEGLWELERFRGALNGDRFRALWPHIARAGGLGDLDLDGVVRVVCARPTFVTELESEAFGADRIDMYAAVLTAHPNRSEAADLAGWVAASLGRLTPDQWQSDMTDSDQWVALLAAVFDAAPNTRIGGVFAQALGKFLDNVANGIEVGAPVAEQWERAVLPLIAPAIRGTYAEGVARAAVRVGGGLPETFFNLAGSDLKEPQIFSRLDILDGLLPDLVTEGNVAGLSWLIAALEDEDARRDVAADGFRALFEVVPTSLGHDADIDEKLRRIADLIGLELQPRPEE